MEMPINTKGNQTTGTSISKVRISGLVVIHRVVRDVIMNADMAQAGPLKDIPMCVAPGLLLNSIKQKQPEGQRRFEAAVERINRSIAEQIEDQDRVPPVHEGGVDDDG